MTLISSFSRCPITNAYYFIQPNAEESKIEKPAIPTQRLYSILFHIYYDDDGSLDFMSIIMNRQHFTRRSPVSL